MNDDYPRWAIDVRHQPGTLGGSWFCDLRRQDKKYGRWVKTNTGQGKTLAVALTAAASGAKRQERNFPELLV
jgi:hypothetical protein